eukprot:scaffold127687_cov39-Phaeocystis_antarctica.AAC.2
MRQALAAARSAKCSNTLARAATVDRMSGELLVLSGPTAGVVVARQRLFQRAQAAELREGEDR